MSKLTEWEMLQESRYNKEMELDDFLAGLTDDELQAYYDNPCRRCNGKKTGACMIPDPFKRDLTPSPQWGNSVLPILVPAFNEQVSIKKTLENIVVSAKGFQNAHTDVKVAIVVCDNNSTDDTRSIIEQFIQTLDPSFQDKITVSLIQESTPGKANVMRTLIKHAESTYGETFNKVVFSDAEIVWSVPTLTALWNTTEENPRAKLIGSHPVQWNEVTNWSLLVTLPFFGYGEKTSPRGQGSFMKIVHGMCYVAKREMLPYFTSLPIDIKSEDTALSAIVGPAAIAIASDARVGYYEAASKKDFDNTRGRHIRENIRLERWMTALYFEAIKDANPTINPAECKKLAAKAAQNRISAVLEVRPYKIALGLFIPYGGRIPFFSMPLKHLYLFVLRMGNEYARLNKKALERLAAEEAGKADALSWETARPKAKSSTK